MAVDASPLPGWLEPASSLRKEIAMQDRFCYRCDRLTLHEENDHGFWVCVMCGTKK